MVKRADHADVAAAIISLGSKKPCLSFLVERGGYSVPINGSHRWTPLSIEITEAIVPSGTDFASILWLRKGARSAVWRAAASSIKPALSN
jgi:hypothetical protein